MIATVKNYDLICYQLRNNLYSQLSSPLKKEIDQLTKAIIALLASGDKIQNQPKEILSQVFDIRVKALKWLSNDDNIDYLELVPKVSSHFEGMKIHKSLEILRENIFFALRCNQRVVSRILAMGSHSSLDFNLASDQLPIVNYQQLLASLAFAVPDDETAQKIIDWTNASLHIEFVILAADIIFTEELPISEKAIHELSFLIADAAQDYIALASEFGILAAKPSRGYVEEQIFDDAFVEEQQHLADMGLDEFASNFAAP